MDGVPGFIKKKRTRRGKFGTGLRYEKEVHKHFLEEFGFTYIPSPWFQYTTKAAPKQLRYAQPDALLIQLKLGLITIVEVKYSHCSGSYFQLQEMYLPLMKKFFSSDWDFTLIEVVKWYDRDIPYPAKTIKVERIDQKNLRYIGVHVWKPGRR